MLASSAATMATPNSAGNVVPAGSIGGHRGAEPVLGDPGDHDAETQHERQERYVGGLRDTQHGGAAARQTMDTEDGSAPPTRPTPEPRRART